MLDLSASRSLSLVVPTLFEAIDTSSSLHSITRSLIFIS